MTDAEHFRVWCRQKRYTQSDVAFHVGKSKSWVGIVMRGHYPWYGKGGVPKHMWDWARSLGMPDPQVFDLASREAKP